MVCWKGLRSIGSGSAFSSINGHLRSIEGDPVGRPLIGEAGRCSREPIWAYRAGWTDARAILDIAVARFLSLTAEPDQQRAGHPHSRGRAQPPGSNCLPRANFARRSQRSGDWTTLPAAYAYYPAKIDCANTIRKGALFVGAPAVHPPGTRRIVHSRIQGTDGVLFGR